MRTMTKQGPDLAKQGGGRRGTRTPDILLVREALYQLSYASEAPQEYAIGGGPDEPGRRTNPEMEVEPLTSRVISGSTTQG